MRRLWLIHEKWPQSAASPPSMRKLLAFPGSAVYTLCYARREAEPRGVRDGLWGATRGKPEAFRKAGRQSRLGRDPFMNSPV